MESDRADAIDAIRSVAALGVFAALCGVAGSLLDTARLVRIAGTAHIADASVGLAVLAVSATGAGRFADGRNNRRNAEEIRIADKVGQADALVGGLVATGAHAASDAFAALLAAAGHADLRFLAGHRGGADVRKTRAARERIAVVAVEAGAGGLGGSGRRDDALSVFSAQDAHAEGDAFARPTILLEAGQTAAPGGVLFGFAVGVFSARKRLARIDAGALDAGELSVAVGVTLALGLPRLTAASLLIGVAQDSGRASAFVAAVFVDALGAGSARIVAALVDIAAAEGGVAGVARLAHALGRIAGRALGIDSARVPLAGAFAFVSVFRVGVVRRRADALARLDAALVGAALRVGHAAHLRRSAEALVRIAGEVARAAAFEAAGPVETLGAETARRLAAVGAFVHVLAGSVVMRSVAGGAGAVAHAARDGDAFGSSRAASLAPGAIGQETGAGHDLVGRLTAALDAVALVAALERIAFEAGRAGTVVAAGQVLTDGPEAAGRLVGGGFEALVDVAAESGGRIANPSAGADTDASAAAGGNADLSAWARIAGGASGWSGDSLATSGLERLAFKSVGALADESAGLISADGAIGAGRFARRALVNVDAASVGSSGESGRAHALGNVADEHALLIGRAAHVLARICKE